MNNSGYKLIISLAPDSLSAAKVRKGRILQSEQVEIDQLQKNDCSLQDLQRLDQPLRQLISRFGFRSTPPATVIYHSNTLSQQVHKFNLTGSSAIDAATAKIRESIGMIDPVESFVLNNSSSNTDSTMTLVFSEREEQLRALYAWLNRSNVKVDTFIPTSVAVMETVASIAAKTEPETAVFYLGADVSVMAYATEDGLKLIRSAEIGYRKLIEGYQQVLLDHAQEHNEGELEQHQIEEIAKKSSLMLFEHGIPMTNDEVDGIHLRSTVLPILAPVLQRFCIEVKQTFRFGLGGIEMPKNLLLCGPGGSIQHMSKAISQHIDMKIKLDPSLEGCTPLVAFSRGTLESYLVHNSSGFDGLLPVIAQNAKTSSMLTRSLTVGAACALVAMGAEYLVTTSNNANTREMMSQNAPRLLAVNEFQNKMDSTVMMSHFISDVSSLVTETVESVPQWHLFLGELSNLKPDSVRILELRGENTLGSPYFEINGIAVAETEKSSGYSLNRFVNDLSSIEVVTHVKLGATSRVNVGEDQWGRKFTMKVTLDEIPLPYESLILDPNNMTRQEMP
ncbi:MAG: hypothetical protein P1U42_02970 [Phycisphaerales bacterium]|nr:hypothetical protein [Phycisphaerales bacterium]